MESDAVVGPLAFVAFYTGLAAWYAFAKRPERPTAFSHAMFSQIPSLMLATIYGTMLGAGIATGGPEWLMYVGIAGLSITTLIAAQIAVRTE